MRGADEPVRGAAHLTLPALRDGSLPLPPEGRRGARVPAGIFLVGVSSGARRVRGSLAGSEAEAAVGVAGDLVDEVDLPGQVLAHVALAFGRRPVAG